MSRWVDVELKNDFQYIKNRLFQESHPNVDWSKQNLKGANLYASNLSLANLELSDVSNANLRYADLTRASLYGADLCGADLHNANLQWCILSHTDLRNADLREANLNGAYVDNAKIDHTTKISWPIACPDTGSFIGWKATTNGHGIGYIIKLEIPENARRSSSTSRKCRCDKAKTLDIQYSNGCSAEIKQVASGNGRIYEIGEMTYPDDWDENRWIECGHGIHFFVTRIEALEYLDRLISKEIILNRPIFEEVKR